MNTAYDVIVLGSGVAGLSAALAARAHGLDVLLVEKANALGGTAASSYGLVWVGNNHVMRAAGMSDSREDILQYMTYLGGGEASQERLETFVDRAPEAILYFSECGIPFRIVSSIVDHYYGRAPGARKTGRTLDTALIAGHELGDWQNKIRVPTGAPYFMTAEELISWGGINRYNFWDENIVRLRKANDMRGKGVGFVSRFVKALVDRNVPIILDETADRLLFEGEKVIGIVTSTGQKIRATKGVVLATGGYERNPELMRDFDSFPSHNPLSLPTLTGDGLIMGAEIGAAIRRLANSLTIMLGFMLIPDDPSQEPIPCLASITETCSPHTMVVNQEGKRFADESYFQSLIPELIRFDISSHTYKNLPCYLIFDSQYTEKYALAHLPAGAAIPKSVFRSESLEALANQLDIDPDGLTATVKQFNEFARAGKDTDFNRGERPWTLAEREVDQSARNPSLGTIEKPPYYGIELHPTMNSGSAGLLTNSKAQVLHQRRYPIEGLYASGVVSSRTDMGTGYQAGLNLASAMTFSYLAVRNMVGRS